MYQKALMIYRFGGTGVLVQRLQQFVGIRFKSIVSRCLLKGQRIKVALEILDREDSSPLLAESIVKLNSLLAESSTKRIIVPVYLKSVFARILKLWGYEGIQVTDYSDFVYCKKEDVLILHKGMMGLIAEKLKNDLINWKIIFSNDLIFICKQQYSTKEKDNALVSLLDNYLIQNSVHELNQNGLIYCVRPNTMDASIVGEVDLTYFNWIREQKIKALKIIDIGGHIGAFSLQIIKHMGPDARVHCFEPAPDNANLIRKNISINNFENKIVLHEKAVAAKRGKLNLYLSPDNTGGHRLAVAGSGAHSAVEVEVVTLSDVWTAAFDSEDVNCDLLKIDVEGSEHDILFDYGPFLKDRVKYIIVEAGGSLHGDGLTMLSFLREIGFDCIYEGNSGLMTIYGKNLSKEFS